MHEQVKSFIYFLEVERGVSVNTVKSYSSDLSKFEDFLVNRKKSFVTATREDILSFMMHLKDLKLNSSSIA
jgi:integrase/recombinase XerD